MSFSRLLLVASSSKKYISGEGKDKVIITPSSLSERRQTAVFSPTFGPHGWQTKPSYAPPGGRNGADNQCSAPYFCSLRQTARDSVPTSDPYAGEVVLCFQLDNTKDKEKLVARSLGIQGNDRRCDGLIFYAQDEQEDKVICFVEMKSTNFADAARQIKSTKVHIKELLQVECGTSCNRQLQHIKWKACFYHHGTSQDEVAGVLKQLKNDGFDDFDNFTSANNNVGPLLRGKVSTKELANKLRRGKKR